MKLSKHDKMLIAALLIYHSVIFPLQLGNSLIADEGTHGLISLFYREALLRIPDFGVDLNSYIKLGLEYLVTYPKIQVTYPPLFHIFTALVTYSVFGVSALAGRVSSLLFSIGAFLVMYLLVKRYLGGRAALVSVLLFFSSFFVMFYVGRFLMDMTGYFFLFLSLYIFSMALERREGKWFILLGAVVFLAGMSKRPAALVGLFILIYSIILRIDKRYIIAFLSTLIILSVPYLFLLSRIGGFQINYLVVQESGAMQGDPGLLSIMNWVYYFWEYLLVEPVGILPLLFFFHHLYRKERFWKPASVYFFIFYLGLSLAGNKEPRLFMYLSIPAIVLFSEKLTRMRWWVIGGFLGAYLIFSAQSFAGSLENNPVKDVALQIQSAPPGGNVGMVSESGYLYSSALMFETAELGRRDISFFRPCVFSEKSPEEIEGLIKRNNIYYVISVPTDSPEFLQNIRNLKALNLTLEKRVGEVGIYRVNDFEFRKGVRCNYICLLKRWVCENQSVESLSL